MKYGLKLEVHAKNPESLLQVVEKETTNIGRSSTHIARKDQKIIFMVEAQDHIALKASINRIIKTLTIFEKIQGNLE